MPALLLPLSAYAPPAANISRHGEEADVTRLASPRHAAHIFAPLPRYSVYLVRRQHAQRMVSSAAPPAFCVIYA